MSDTNDALKQAEAKLKKAAGQLAQAENALEADQLVEAIVDNAVPDLAQNAPEAELRVPPDGKAGTLDQELDALKANDAKTKFDEQVAAAEE